MGLKSFSWGYTRIVLDVDLMIVLDVALKNLDNFKDPDEILEGLMNYESVM